MAKTKAQGWSVLTVQGILCTGILLLALAARLMGGTVYEQLHAAFGQAITQDIFLLPL